MKKILFLISYLIFFFIGVLFGENKQYFFNNLPGRDEWYKRLIYLDSNINVNNVCKYEILTSPSHSKIKIISPFFQINKNNIYPIFQNGSNEYLNYILLNENAYPINIQIFLDNPNDSGSACIKIIELKANEYKYLITEEIDDLLIPNNKYKAKYFRLLSDTDVKIFRVFGFSYQDSSQDLLTTYLPILNNKNDRFSKNIFIYNVLNDLSYCNIEGFDNYGNSMGILYDSPIKAFSIHNINIFNILPKQIYDKLDYVKVNTIGKIICCSIFEDKSENSFYILRHINYVEARINNNAKKSEIESSTALRPIEADNDNSLGIIWGSVGKIYNNSNSVDAEIIIKNELPIWLTQKKVMCTEGAKINDDLMVNSDLYIGNTQTILASMGLLCPSEQSLYLGNYSDDGQKIFLIFENQIKASLITIIDTILSALWQVGPTKIVKIYYYIDQLLQIPTLYHAAEDLLECFHHPLLSSYYEVKIIINITKTFINSEYRKEFWRIIKPIVPVIGAEDTADAILDVIHIISGRVGTILKSFSGLIQYEYLGWRDPEVLFYTSKEFRGKKPIINEILPTVVDEGNFEINIFGSNYDNDCKVKLYSENDNIFRSYLQILENNKNKILATGNIKAGKYYVLVVNSNSQESNQCSLTIKPKEEKKLPLAPTDLNAKGLSATQIELRWKDNSSNEDGFNIEGKIKNDPTWLKIGQVNSDYTYFLHEQLFPDTEYSYRLRAFNNIGYSAFSGEVSSKTMPASNPAPFIKYISPTIVNKGEFTINIIGNYFDQNSEILVLFESDNHFVCYLNKENITTTKIIANGRIEKEGFYILYIKNLDSQISNKTKFEVRTNLLNPIAKISMRSQGKIAYENETLTLIVPIGGEALVEYSAERSYDPDGSIVGYEWKINGIKVNTSSSFSNNLGKGTYQIYLVVKDNDSLENSVGGTVVVNEQTANQPPVALFDMSAQGKSAKENETLTLTVAPGATVQVSFTAQRSYDPDGTIAAYNWKGSGNTINTARDFAFSFGKGTHQILLTVKDNGGATGSVGGTVVVNEQTANQPPVALFDMSAQGKSAKENETLTLTVAPGATVQVSFTAQRSYDPDGTIAAYNWKGSGNTISTSRDFTFSLGKGTHQILLTVTDNGGATGSVGGTVVVNETNQPPVALFDMNAQGKSAKQNETLILTVSPGATVPVSFTAQRSYDPDGSITAYGWKGSGNPIGTSRDFTYSFSKGTHQILLTVTDNLGATGSVGGTVVVNVQGDDWAEIVSLDPPPGSTVKFGSKVNATINYRLESYDKAGLIILPLDIEENSCTGWINEVFINKGSGVVGSWFSVNDHSNAIDKTVSRKLEIQMVLETGGPINPVFYKKTEYYIYYWVK